MRSSDGRVVDQESRDPGSNLGTYYKIFYDWVQKLTTNLHNFIDKHISLQYTVYGTLSQSHRLDNRELNRQSRGSNPGTDYDIFLNIKIFPDWMLKLMYVMKKLRRRSYIDEILE